MSRVDSAEGMPKAMEFARQFDHDVVIQEFVTGPSISLEVIGKGEVALPLQTTQVILDEHYDCKMVLAPCLEMLHDDQEFLEMGGMLGSAMRLQGIMDIEAIVHNKVAKVIELDARFPSQTPSAVYHSTGMNMVGMLFDWYVKDKEPRPRMARERQAIYEHIRVRQGRLESFGEAMMSDCRHLRRIKGFHGADVALTDFTADAEEWRATMITTGNNMESAFRKRDRVLSSIMDQYQLGTRYDSVPGRGGRVTRLTPGMISGLESTLPSLDADLIRMTGLGLRGLALAAIGLPANHSFAVGTKVAAVPMTSGLGRIAGFPESLASVSRFIGLESFVTQESDVAGIREAYERSADVMLMADDNAFLAVSTRRKVWADNSECTALGYVEALQRAAGEIGGEEVLVVGAGQLGLHAIRMLMERGMKVRVVEKNPRLLRVITRDIGLEAHMLLEEALVNAKYVFNASPAPIQGSLVREGMVLSNPGVPLGVDELARRRCKAIIHDPLAIGTAVMLTKVLSAHRPGETGRPEK